MKKHFFILLRKSSIFLLFFTMLSMNDLQAQTTITGSVVDENGLGLPGVNLMIKSSNKSASTDFEGKFSLAATKGEKISISFIGYITQEVVLSDQKTLKINLKPDFQSLEEVVVVGYGKQKKSDLTGSVGVLTSKDIDKFTYQDATQAIQGRMAGVNVQSPGGAPGASSIITIRGSGTLSDGGPLYVIDGMFTSNMSGINPADIESISVLKDASASAIYGSRAANGVVIITTKKGKKGELSIDADYNVGIQTVINKLDWATAREYADIVNKARDNDGATRFPANDTQFNPNNTSDIQNESLRSAMMKSANLRMYGGGESGQYSLSLNHLDQEGIVRESGFKRTTVRSNVSFTKGRFQLENSIGLTRTENDYNNYFNKERDLIPTIRTRNDKGEFSATDIPKVVGAPSFGAYYGVGSAINSLGLASIEDRTVTRNTVLANIGASYKIIDGLTYKLNLGLEYYTDNNYRFTPLYEFNPASLGNTQYNELSETNTNYVSTLVENTLNYKKKFADIHDIDVIVGYTEQVANSRSLGAVARRLPSNDIRVASAALDRVQMPSRDLTKGIQSYFGRLNYSYDGKYLLTTTIRRDGSSLFNENLRYGVFPSVALGWNLSKESFMKNVESISDIKIRASYGEIGSDNIDIYSKDPELNLNSEYIVGTGNQGRVPGYSITKGVNSNVFWETTRTTDIGVEFSALNKKLNVTLDYFEKQSSDVLVSLGLPLYTGFDNRIPFNTASVSNKGFEFTGVYADRVGEFNYNVSVNVSTLKNRVTALGDATPIVSGSFTSNGISGTRTDVGQPIGAFYGYVMNGIYQTNAEATAAKDANNPKAGDIKFADLNNDGFINDKDRQYLGSPIPDLMYGITLAGDYKNFDFNLLFDGVAGNKILNGTKYRGYFDREGNYLADALNAWSPTNTSSLIPRNTQLDPGFNRRMSDFYLESGAFFRLRNIQIGYSLPSVIVDKLKISKFRIYATGTNVFTITKYTGYYPEVGRNARGGGPNIFSAGVDEGSYPTPRIYQVGIQVSF